MHEVLVNRLGGLSLPRKKTVVWLADCPVMTLGVNRGRKNNTIQYNTIQYNTNSLFRK